LILENLCSEIGMIGIYSIFEILMNNIDYIKSDGHELMKIQEKNMGQHDCIIIPNESGILMVIM
jgi:hypothetical protein